MEYTYSVAIPHYNSPRLLSRMLKSIPERDDIQVIVVDDGSKKENVSEMKRLQHKNLQLILLGENKGGGYARNIGLQHATGKWFISVDADDYFSDNAFEVFDKYKEDDIECLYFFLNCVDENGNPNGNKSHPNESVKNYYNNPTKKTEQALRFQNTTSWNKLVSLQFIRDHDIEYEDCRVNIDVYYSFCLGIYVKKFKIIPQSLYNLVSSENSITRQKRSIIREFVFYLQVQKRNGFFEKIGMKYWPYYRYDFLYIPHMIKKRGIRGAIEFFKYRNKHIEEVKEARKQYLSILKRDNYE